MNILALERGASTETLRAYGSDLRQFAAYLRDPDLALDASQPLGAGPIADAGRILAADRLDIRGYLACLKQRGVKKSSMMRKLAAVRTMYRYLWRDGVIASNPASSVATPKQDKPLPIPRCPDIW